MATQQTRSTTFKVLDALDGPHGGRILRLRLVDGDAPSVRSLKGARLRAVSPEGDEHYMKVEGFPSFGGRPSDERLSRTGRVDLHVMQEDADAPAVGLQWQVSFA